MANNTSWWRETEWVGEERLMFWVGQWLWHLSSSRRFRCSDRQQEAQPSLPQPGTPHGQANHKMYGLLINIKTCCQWAHVSYCTKKRWHRVGMGLVSIVILDTYYIASLYPVNNIFLLICLTETSYYIYNCKKPWLLRQCLLRSFHSFRAKRPFWKWLRLQPCDVASRSFIYCHVVIRKICLPTIVLQMS